MATGAITLLPLRFRIGELTLCTATLPAITVPVRFSDFLDQEVSPPDFAPLPEGVQIRLFRSYPVTQPLPRIQLLSGAIRYVPSLYKRFFTRLNGAFADYLKHFSAKSRSTLTRKLRRFTESSNGDLRWKKYGTRDEMEEFHRLAREISAKTYQERLLDAGLPADEAYLESLQALASRDQVRAFILFHQDVPAAYLCCPAVDDSLLYEYVGYDPQFAHLSPGTVLQYVAFESLFAENRFKIFDFTEGEGPHKSFFATQSLLCADIYFFRRTWRNLALVRSHDTLLRSSAALVQILNRIGAKAYLKKLIRQVA